MIASAVAGFTFWTPGPGGWAFFRETAHGPRGTSASNAAAVSRLQMELFALRKLLQAAESIDEELVVVTDSTFLLHTIDTNPTCLIEPLIDQLPELTSFAGSRQFALVAGDASSNRLLRRAIWHARRSAERARIVGSPS